LGSADLEAPRAVDQVLGLLIHHVGRERREHDTLQDLAPYRLVIDLGTVVTGDDDGVDVYGPIVSVPN